MRIDAYSATVPGDPLRLLDGIQATLQAEGFAQVEVRPFASRFYDQGAQVFDGTGVLASIQFGGNNGAQPSVQAQGEQAAALCSWLRLEYPDHRCTRVDAAHDLAAPGLFDAVHPILVQLGKDSGVSLPRAGDWDTPRAGRTQYLGSPKSPRRLRMYEKGLQLLAASPLADADPNHVRLEVQYRPEHSEQKDAAARLSPLEVFGISEWTRDALATFCGTHAPEVNLRVHRERNDERARRFLCEQYGRVLLTWLTEVGTPEQLGIALVDQVREQRRIRAIRRVA